MSIFSHNVYENIRTRVIVLHQQQILLLPPVSEDEGWQVPGGGLEPNESLADCAVREVWEETGLHIQVMGVAFLREWVVPQYCIFPDKPGQIGYGLEVFLVAHPVDASIDPRPEGDSSRIPRWIPLVELDGLPLWPKELKALAATLLSGQALYGIPAIVAQLESPMAAPTPVPFNERLNRQ
jgi:8-oxo-dGTP pyrophosphatase MutT (NUDIX family)